jgi:hypothetical protein
MLVTLEPSLQSATIFAQPRVPQSAQHAQLEITGRALFAKLVQIFSQAVILVQMLERVLAVQDHNFYNMMDYLV